MDFNFELSLFRISDLLRSSLKKVSYTQWFGRLTIAPLLAAGIWSASAFAAPGTLDTTFGTDGLVMSNFTNSNDVGYALVQDSSGRTLVGGFSGMSTFTLARYTTTGVLDPTFGTKGVAATIALSGGAYGITALAIQRNGDIVAVGTNLTSSGKNEFAVARYTSSGVLDATFGTGGTGYVTTSISSHNDIPFAVALDSSGNIIVAGVSNQDSNSGVFTVVRYTSSGAVDTTFGSARTGIVTTSITGNNDIARGVTTDSSGNILVAGFDNANGKIQRWNVVRYTKSGALDTTFNSGGTVPGIATINFTYGYNILTAIALESNGSIVVSGGIQVGSSGGMGLPVTNIAAARLTSSGVLDTTFNGTGIQKTSFGTYQSSNSFGMLIQPDGKIVLAGNNEDANTTFALVRYNTDGSLDTTFNAAGTLPGTVLTAFNTSPSFAFGLAFNTATQRLTVGGYASDGVQDYFALACYYDDDTDTMVSR